MYLINCKIVLKFLSVDLWSFIYEDSQNNFVEFYQKKSHLMLIKKWCISSEA